MSMIIGGTDIVIPGANQPADWTLVVEHMVRAWPHGLLEVPGALGTFTHRFLLLCGIPEELARNRPTELFVYRSPASLSAWTGDAPKDADGMIHVLFGADEITCVVGQRESEAGAVVEALRKALIEAHATRQEIRHA